VITLKPNGKINQFSSWQNVGEFNIVKHAFTLNR